jgi:membrane-bound metal-dependent hydrolase YbcI (DUF457 family)
MFVGEAPDLDVFAAPLGPWAFWLQHRGITHSLVGFIAQALFFAWAFRRWDPGVYWRRAALYLVPLLLHGFCDYLTSYGVPLLSPFSFHEFSADVTPSVTLIPLIFMAWGLVRLYRNGREGWGATRSLWLAWAVYVVFSFGGQAYAAHLMAPFTDGTDRVTVVSGVLNPFGWTAVEQRAQCCRYHATHINILTRSIRPGLTLEAGTDELPVVSSMQSDLVRRFVATTRWPVARTTSTPFGWDVDWGKVLFSTRGLVRAQIRAEVGLDGKLIRAEHLFEFWDPKENKVDVGPAEPINATQKN